MACFGPLVTKVSSTDGAKAIASFVLAILGDATALFVYFSPVITFWDIRQKQSVEQHRAVPYVFGLMNSILWFLYGLPQVHTHSTLMLCLNGLGVFMMFVYLAIFLYFCDEERRWLLGYVLTFEVFGLVILGLLVIRLCDEPEDRASVLGVFAVITACCMYLTPVLDIIPVCASKNVESAPISLLVIGCSLMNATVWTVQSSITKNPFVYIPNGLGMLIPVVQLSVHYHYKKKAQAAGNAAQGN